MSISGHTPGGGGGTASATHEDHFHNLADEAAATVKDAKAQGAEQYEHLRAMATDQIDSLAEGAQSAASALEGKDSLGLSQYLGQLASGLSSFADQVKDQSAEQLLHKGAQLARDNPALFLAGSVAVGFGLSRFLKATASHGDESVPDTAPATSDSLPKPSASASDSSHSSPAATPSIDPIPDPLGEAATYPNPTVSKGAE